MQKIFQVWDWQLKKLSALLLANFLLGAFLPLSDNFSKMLQMLFGLLDY